MASSKTKQSKSRRSLSQRPPVAVSTKKTLKRVKKIHLSLPLLPRLEISIRKFRTNPARRSKRYKQWVVQPDVLGIREIALAAKPLPKKRAQNNIRGAALPSNRRWSAAATAIIICSLAGALYFGSHLQKPVSFDIKPQAVKALAVSPPAAAKSMPKSVPTKLVIPKIGLDTVLAQAGLQSDGAIKMPWDIGTAAWYKYSPTPGEIGPSVIVGHLDGANYINMKGVFWRLNELLPGDQIKVYRADGSIAKFKVIGLKQVSQANFPTSEIYGNIPYAGLRVITCGGTFDSATGHYSDNTVVFAALE